MKSYRKDLLRRLHEHSSILTMAVGAVSLYFSNIFLKSTLSESDFGLFSLLITYFAIINSFGLLGLEQTFMRFCSVNKNNEVLISQTIRNKILSAILLIIIISIFISRLDFFDNFYIGIVCTLSIVISMFSYNLLRIQKRYHLSQFILSFWRWMLGIIIIASFSSFFIIDYNLLLELMTYGLFVMLLISSLIIINNIKIDKNLSSKKFFDKKEFLVTSNFFLILLSGSFISVGDRLFIEHYFSAAEFGNYVYYSLLLLYPFNFLQNYLGFKFLVGFKEVKSFKNLIEKYTKALVWISIGFVILIYSFNYTVYRVINNDFLDYKTLTLIFFLTGIVKLFYSVYSSLVGAHSGVKVLKSLNKYYLFIIFIVGFFILIFPISSIEMIALIYLLLWLSRLLLWKSFSKKLINND